MRVSSDTLFTRTSITLCLCISICFISPAVAQNPAAPQEMSKATLAQLLRQLNAKGEMQQMTAMRWASFAGRSKSDNECAALAELYSEIDTTEARTAILRATLQIKHQAIVAIRNKVVSENKAAPDIVGLSLLGMGYTADYGKSALVVPFFYNKSAVVRQAALEALGHFVNRYEGWPTDRFIIGERSYSKFANFRKYVEERTKDENGEIRAVASKVLFNCSESLESFGLERLKKMTSDKSDYVRFVFAKIALENPNADLVHHLIPLLADKPGVAHSASLAVYKRLSPATTRKSREAIRKALDTDLAREDSCVIESPLVLFQLAELDRASGEFKSAEKYYRLCVKATKNGGVLPIYFKHNIGATAHIRITELLRNRGDIEKAQKELMDAHYNFRGAEMVQVSPGLVQPLGNVLHAVAKELGGPKFFPPVPGRDTPKTQPQQRNPEPKKESK